MAKTKYRVQKSLHKYVPSLIVLLENQSMGWLPINQRFDKKMNSRIDNPSLGYRLNFYDLLVKSEKGDLGSKYFLQYIELMCADFINELSVKEKEWVRSIIKKFLGDLSGDYIHYVGELFALESLLKTNQYRFDGIDYKLKNGKDIDFKLFNLKKNEEVLIEAMNIHLDQEKNELDVKKFLIQKFEEKIQLKTEQQEISDFDFRIFPVLWGSPEKLKIISLLYKADSILMTNVLEPFSYKCWCDEPDRPSWRFGKISTLFE